jgi:PAS domain S-box-containing protein
MNKQHSINAGRDPMMVLDPNHRILAVNKKIITATGLSAAELIGRHCHEIFSSQPSPCSERSSMNPCTGDTMFFSGLVQRAHNKIFHVRPVPVLGPDNRVQYIICIARDITDAEKLEEKLFQTHRMETIGTLAGGIAHDFNNILTAILGFAEIARVKLSMGRSVADEIDEVIAASRRAADLVGQILRYSRSDDQQRRPLRMDLIVKEALKMLRSTLPATIDIHTDISRNGTLVSADPTSIHQIVVNLCTNALRAIGPGKGNLQVTLKSVSLLSSQIPPDSNTGPGSFVELAIRDSGRGMDEKTLSRIFEPYFTTRAQGEGTGIGLAVTRGIVHKHDGFIQVESVPGQGSVFYIYLPAIKEEDFSVLDEQEETPLPAGREHILFIDDESAIVNFGRSLLGRLGYHVSTETDSITALARFKADPSAFDLVITDQTMHGLTGLELARSMLRLRPDLPIILCTGYSAALSAKEAYSVGIKSFLAKPLDTRILAETVRGLLDGKAKK